MVEKEGSYDNTDWSGTGTKTIDVLLESFNDIYVLRYVNDLNVSVDIAVEATDSDDTNFSQTEDLRGGTSDFVALTVSASDVGSDFLTEPWEKLRVSITPSADPTSGNFELRSMDK